MPHSLQPHELQNAGLLCPLSIGVCSNSCPKSQRCHPTISSSVTLFCSQSFPASGYFPMALRIRWLKYQSISFGISPFNEYSGLISFRIDWFNLFAVQGLSRVFSSTTVQKHQFFSAQLSLWSNSHNPHMTTGKTVALTIQTFVSRGGYSPREL